MLSAVELHRYSRHLALTEVGLEGQQKLRAARVLLIGGGGLGAPAALYLAAAGVGTLGVLDFDQVDESNLQRQVLYRTGDVGLAKADSARAHLTALNPHIDVRAHTTELHAANVRALFAPYDLILDGSDRLATRYLVNDACVLYGKKLVTAAVHRFEGQAMSYVPGQGPCYRCVFPSQQDGVVPNCATAGVLGVLPGVLGTLQATEAIKLILGIGEPLLGRLLVYDALSLRFDEFRTRRRSDCAVCGDTPSIREPADPPGFCTQQDLQQVAGISATLLAQRLQDGEALRLIDVREADEFAQGHLPGSINCPLAQWEQSSHRPPGSGPLVFICQSGVRSARAAALARRAGLSPVLQLEGGLAAYATSAGKSSSKGSPT